MVKKKKNRDKQSVTFELLTEFYHELVRPDLKKIEKKVDRNSEQIQVNTRKIDDNANKIDENTKKIEVNTTKLDKLDDQFDGLKAEFSDTPSRKEFTELEDKVERMQAS